MSLLCTRGLTKRFGGVTAVDGVDFALSADECCSLIGPNGAGKTTFFNLLTGSLAPTAGTVEYRPAAGDGAGQDTGTNEAPTETDGWRDVTDASPHETARLGIHRSYQITNIFPAASVLENVRIAAQAHGGADSWRLWRNVGAFEGYEEEARAILERVGIAEHAGAPADTLSHGQKRHLEVAIALAGDPDVLLLDEPTAGVSRGGVEQIVDLIDDVAADHAVLLVEHNMEVVMDVSDRIAVLHRGQLIADGNPAAIREDPDVQRAYLGGYEDDGDGATASESADDGTDDDAGDGTDDETAGVGSA